MSRPAAMRRPLRRLAVLLLAAGLCGIAADARSDCTALATGVVFGGYDIFGIVPLDGVGTITVACVPLASFTVSLSPGGGSYSQRRMSGNGDTLDYNLYTNASRSVVWGDGTAGTATVGGSGVEVLLNVYGRIPDGQNPKSGTYGDTIIVTVSF